MKYLSICSGIEAATVAWHPLGFEPVAFSEIEPFPSAVLAHHYPDVPNLGDMTKYKEWPYERGSIDILVGGTPCQSFSVAGLRKGLSDPRGNLALVYLGIADHFRPRWVVWENVPGVLSSNGGRDFGSFFGALSELGYGWAYRVIDAQHLGVPQRRRRVFVVGYLGDWRTAAAVLFERESMRRDIEKSRKAREIASAVTATGVGTCGADDNQAQARHLVAVQRYYDNHGQDSRVTGPHEIAETVSAKYGTGGGNTPIIMAHGQANAEIREDGQATTLTCNHEAPIIAFPERMSGTQRATSENISPSLMAKNPTAVAAGYSVRRLTPVECERLQGFPDNYTRIPWKNKPAEKCPDAPRYKAIGNSMAVPAMRRIGERIQSVENIKRELSIAEESA